MFLFLKVLFLLKREKVFLILFSALILELMFTHTHTHTHTYIHTYLRVEKVRYENQPLQYSGLENLMDGGDW